MASRIFWVMLAGAALVTGMILQDGDRIFSMAAESESLASVERSIEASVERAVEGSVDQMQVIDADGNEIDVPAETKQALGAAVGRLVKAEADLAILRIRDGNDLEIRAANARRAEARAEVDRLKAEIRGKEPAATTENGAVREQIRAEIRESVREAVRN